LIAQLTRELFSVDARIRGAGEDELGVDLRFGEKVHSEGETIAHVMAA